MMKSATGTITKKVSVIIPCYNEEKNIAVVLDSIAKQSYRNTEVIIIDDFSSDKTSVAAKKTASKLGLRLKVIRPGIHQERGIIRNLGAKNATGAFLIFLDADMKMSKNVIQNCVKKTMQRGGVKGTIIPEVSIGEGYWANVKSLEKKCYIGDDSIEAARFFEKKAFFAIGGWDEKMISGEDWDLTKRFREKYKVGRINDLIYHNEGKLTLLGSARKKFYYAQMSKPFLKSNKKTTGEVLRFIFRPAFLKNWKLLLTDPIHALGIIVLKFTEFSAGALGMLLVKSNH